MMTDKDLDKLIKDALMTEDVPNSLNESLMVSIRKKDQKKANVLKFVKACSSCAAVFICAVAVASYFNNNTEKYTKEIKKETIIEQEETVSEKDEIASQKEKNLPEKKSTVSPDNEKNDSSLMTDEREVLQKEITSLENSDEEKTVASSPPNVASPAENKASSPKVASPAESKASTDEESEEAVMEDSSPTVFSRAISLAPSSLSELFDDGYDYKTIISERILLQIDALSYKEEVTFSEISGKESFFLNEENVLTVCFASGEIAPEEYGDLFFSVGTLQNGILE